MPPLAIDEVARVSRQIIDEVVVRLAQTRTLRRGLDVSGLEAVATNLRGLTEEEADRAISQAVVTRYGLVPETVTDVLDAKKDLLRRSGMLEFVDAADNMAAIGGLQNLKEWLAQRRGAWDEAAPAGLGARQPQPHAFPSRSCAVRRATRGGRPDR